MKRIITKRCRADLIFCEVMPLRSAQLSAMDGMCPRSTLKSPQMTARQSLDQLAQVIDRAEPPPFHILQADYPVVSLAANIEAASAARRPAPELLGCGRFLRTLWFMPSSSLGTH